MNSRRKGNQKNLTPMTSNETLAAGLLFKYDKAISEVSEKDESGFNVDYFGFLVFIPLIIGLIIMVNHFRGDPIQREASDMESVPPFVHSALERTRSPCLLEYKLHELKRREHEEDYSPTPPVLYLKPIRVEDSQI